jgi:uncharacterized protein with PQ loop repeat
MQFLLSLAATIAVFSLIPQVVRAWRVPHGSSLLWSGSAIFATSVWTVHGYQIHDLYILLSNLGMLLCFIAILLIRYFRSPV